MKDTRRRWLLKRLERYEPYDEQEASMLLRLMSFAIANEKCCDRRLKAGHVVVGAWIVDRPRESAVLLHHRKLEKWLQPGGHVENDPSLIDAASREVSEETGLRKFRLLSAEIFDVDVHTIPARKSEPEHIHYDVRFVFEAAKGARLHLSDESNELEWVKLERITARNDSASIRRLVEKTRLIG
jgi:8-oxo-dGTP pyrophosphatase MutT (NUDIX family)